MSDQPSLKILVIDDDKLFLESITLFLEDMGCTVLPVMTGEQGLEEFPNFRPELVLVDLNMPGINGIQVLEAVNDQAPDTPTIMISGTGEIQDALDAMHKGAWDFITKPIIDFFVLEHAITKVMDRVGLIRKNHEYQEELRRHNKLLEEKVEQRTRELHQAKTAANAANKAKSDFLANITHELRTPLHGIINFAELGIRGIDRYDTERQLDFLKEIRSSGERLLVLINNLLDLSRLDSGRMEYDFASQSLTAIIQEAIGQFSQILAAKRMHIDFDPPSFQDNAPVDAKRIVQVVANLLSNAIKFSPAGSSIRIRICEDPENLIVSVADDGIGIPEAELADVFNPFTLSSKTDDGSGGTGLGLPICRQIIADHRGKIRAENSPEKGATVTFSLPKTYVMRKMLGELLLEEKIISKDTLSRLLTKQAGE